MHLVRAGKRKFCRILMYHRFPGPEPVLRARLEAQCEHLRRYYQPVTLSEIAHALAKGSALPANGVAITVDDGYADFAAAFPVFHKFGLPVTLYAVSEFVDQCLWLWPDRVEKLFQATRRASVSIPLPGGRTLEFPLADAGARRRAIVELDQELVRARNADRLRILQELPERLEATLPETPPEDCRALTWDQLRAMAAEGLEVGAHTRTHPILANVERQDDLVEEIAGSKRRIEEAGIRVRHFCYPNGTRADYTPAAMAAAREAGYETAVVAERGMVGPGADAYQLPRIGAEPDYNPLYFERSAAGFRI